MIRVLIFTAALLACTASLHGEDPSPGGVIAIAQRNTAADQQTLLKRIELLEQRIKELEHATKHNPYYGHGRQYPIGWGDDGKETTGPSHPIATDARTPSSRTVPPGSILPSIPNSPSGWKPIYFNGQWFYMVPADIAATAFEPD